MVGISPVSQLHELQRYRAFLWYRLTYAGRRCLFFVRRHCFTVQWGLDFQEADDDLTGNDVCYALLF